ncbi:MAG TPA: hypothetical protein VJ227_04070, partial [Patescibacteria group bacterium]|nr:hypothetical protein [Patescibacteria group bacterium]
HDDSGNETCGGGACFTGNRLTLCWGGDVAGISATAPALEFSLFYEMTPGDYATVRIGRAAFDPNSSRAASSSNFDDIDGACSGIDGVEYAFEKSLNLSSLMLPGASPDTEGVLRFARIRMLYNTDRPHFVGVMASGDVFPSQGINVLSTGTAGTATRRVAVFQSWPEVPSVFDYAVFSSTGIVK